MSSTPAILTAVLALYFVLMAASARKNRQRSAYKETYQRIYDDPRSRRRIHSQHGGETRMTISELHVYPIKSLRGIRVPRALVTAEGFYLDRRYMLLKIDDDNLSKPKSMHVTHIPAMMLFETGISSTSSETFTITYNGTNVSSGNTIELPFEPSHDELNRLGRVHVDMYTSACSGYDMGRTYNEWFSDRFGYKVILAFWGDNPRPVHGNLPGRPSNEMPKAKNAVLRFLKSLPILDALMPDDIVIAFNDMASFLVISETSVKDVTQRLEGKAMDAAKFRPNVIVRGSQSAYEEDYWAELDFNPGDEDDECKMLLTANCVRCASLNVGYNGQWAEGKEGQVLKLLQKDRRVDAGIKYSPVFGRYGFPRKGDAGKVLQVGDEVVVSRKNTERTTFAWKGYNI